LGTDIHIRKVRWLACHCKALYNWKRSASPCQQAVIDFSQTDRKSHAGQIAQTERKYKSSVEAHDAILE
jgi:hypothetical protein